MFSLMYKSSGFWHSSIFIFFSLFMHFMSNLRKQCKDQCHDLSRIFSSKSFIIVFLMFKYLILLSFFLIYGIGEDLSFFVVVPCRYLVFNTVCWKHSPFSLCGHGNVVKDNLIIYTGFMILDYLFCSLIYLSILVPVPDFYFYSFLLKSESVLSLFFLLKTVWLFIVRNFFSMFVIFL